MPAVPSDDDPEPERALSWLVRAATAAAVVYAGALALQLYSGAGRADPTPVRIAALAISGVFVLAAGSVFCRMYWRTQRWWCRTAEAVWQRDARREVGLAGATFTASAALWVAWLRPDAGYLTTIGITLIPIAASLMARGWLDRRVPRWVDRAKSAQRRATAHRSA